MKYSVTTTTNRKLVILNEFLLVFIISLTENSFIFSSVRLNSTGRIYSSRQQTVQQYSSGSGPLYVFTVLSRDPFMALLLVNTDK